MPSVLFLLLPFFVPKHTHLLAASLTAISASRRCTRVPLAAAFLASSTATITLPQFELMLLLLPTAGPLWRSFLALLHWSHWGDSPKVHFLRKYSFRTLPSPVTFSCCYLWLVPSFEEYSDEVISREALGFLFSCDSSSRHVNSIDSVLSCFFLFSSILPHLSIFYFVLSVCYSSTRTIA